MPPEVDRPTLSIYKVKFALCASKQAHTQDDANVFLMLWLHAKRMSVYPYVIKTKGIVGGDIPGVSGLFRWNASIMQ
jgi:hypothetical protein